MDGKQLAEIQSQKSNLQSPDKNSRYSKISQSVKKSSHQRANTASNQSSVANSIKMRCTGKSTIEYECQLLSDDRNYTLSPAARHAMRDGSLDKRQTYMGRTFNRKLRMRDTFTKIFPTYNHGEASVKVPSMT